MRERERERQREREKKKEREGEGQIKRERDRERERQTERVADRARRAGGVEVVPRAVVVHAPEAPGHGQAAGRPHCDAGRMRCTYILT